jgi:hypothetical protein
MPTRNRVRTRDIAEGAVNDWAALRANEIDQSLPSDPYRWAQARLSLEIRRAAAVSAIGLLADWWSRV